MRLYPEGSQSRQAHGSRLGEPTLARDGRKKADEASRADEVSYPSGPPRRPFDTISSADSLPQPIDIVEIVGVVFVVPGPADPEHVLCKHHALADLSEHPQRLVDCSAIVAEQVLTPYVAIPVLRLRLHVAIAIPAPRPRPYIADVQEMRPADQQLPPLVVRRLEDPSRRWRRPLRGVPVRREPAAPCGPSPRRLLPL